MATTYSRELERLTQSGLQPADPERDVRGRKVTDRLGEQIGTVVDVLIDPAECRIRMIEVLDGQGLLGIRRKHHLVPIEAIVGGDTRTIALDCDRESLPAADEYRQSEGDEEEAQYRAAYAAFDVTPYWEVQAQARG